MFFTLATFSTTRTLYPLSALLLCKKLLFTPAMCAPVWGTDRQRTASPSYPLTKTVWQNISFFLRVLIMQRPGMVNLNSIFELLKLKEGLQCVKGSV